MNVERSSNFARWTATLIEKAKAGDPYSQRVAARVLDQLRYLQALPEAPIDESATLKRVRQSRKYRLWRLSHAFDPEVAVRTICWFDSARDTAVVALLAADKRSMGDVFYDSVGSRADQIIEEWLRQKENPA